MFGTVPPHSFQGGPTYLFHTILVSVNALKHLHPSIYGISMMDFMNMKTEKGKLDSTDRSAHLKIEVFRRSTDCGEFW